MAETVLFFIGSFIVIIPTIILFLVMIKGVFPSWDNTARKAYTNAFIFDNLTPDNYKIWLRDCIKYTKDTKNKELQYVFINAWNEWAEGAHLEADTKYGYAYLQATKDVLEQTRKN